MSYQWLSVKRAAPITVTGSQSIKALSHITHTPHASIINTAVSLLLISRCIVYFGLHLLGQSLHIDIL